MTRVTILVAAAVLSACAADTAPPPGADIVAFAVGDRCIVGDCSTLDLVPGETLDIGLEWIEAELGGMPGFRLEHRQTLSQAEVDDLVGW